MGAEPYKSARRVFWIVDNDSSHAGKTSIARMQDTYEPARLTPNDFAGLDALSSRLMAFGERYRQIARPFELAFTRAKLDALLARIADREPHLRPAA
ncbi:hypothetical protein J7E99_38955 [Streptomyces sp. ISL-44]|uniref:hypothetical protein n=1 Tax=Streptomyces sp. ISL-44 TaxID=2819184 RepID=UPI001BED05D9|nr:hypothetical protein [Streptomyces sp. ISL-44]MBT2546479.1 hypothetical protein [Streptomyces sp. ISL-44]